MEKAELFNDIFTSAKAYIYILLIPVLFWMQPYKRPRISLKMLNLSTGCQIKLSLTPQGVRGADCREHMATIIS